MKTKPVKLVPLFLAIICCCIGGIGVLFYQRIGLDANYQMWLSKKPSEYYMEVTEMRPNGGPWKWAILVKEDMVSSYTVLEADTHGRENNYSWLAPDVLTIEQVFLIAKQQCVSRGLLDCGIVYNTEYHFPKLVDSYEVIIVKVDNFIDCSQAPANCPSSLLE